MSQNDFSDNRSIMGDTGEMFSPLYILRALRRHPVVFIALVLIVMLLTVGYIARAVPIYRSTVTLEIELQSTSVLGRGVEIYASGAGLSYWANKNYYATQYEIIKSYAVSAKVLSMLPEDKKEKLAGGATVSSVEQAVNTLRSRISVVPQKNSNIVRVSVEHPDPVFAAFLAEEVAKAYLDFNIEKKYVATKEAARWLLEQSINLKKQLEESELAIFDFKKKHHILSTTFDNRKELLSKTISNISEQLTDEKMKWKKQQALLEQLDKIDFSDPRKFFLSDVAKNQAMIESLKTTYLKLMEEYEDKLTYYGDKHPEIISLKKRLNAVHDALMREISGIKENLQLEADTTKSSINKLKGMMLAVQKEMVELSKLEITYSKLKRDVETNKKLYDIVLQRTKQADLSAMLKANNIRVIDHALVPSSPIKPRKRLIMLIGVLLALLLGFGAVLLIEIFSKHIRDVDELEQITGKNIIGFIPRIDHMSTDDARHLFFDMKDHSVSVEAVRTIRTNIHLAAPDNERFSLLVTSAVPKEGKTTVAGNIALAFAGAGKKVVLIDADMRRPQIHRMFDIPNTKGITTILLGEVSIDEVVYTDPEKYPLLSVIVCGPVSPTPQEMIASQKFAAFMQELQEKFEVVIIDSPPLSPVADAVILSSMVDSTLLVSRLEYERRDAVKHAVRTLQTVGAKVIGIVVNDIDTKKNGYYYSYSYRYGGGYYSYTPREGDDE